MSWEQLGLFLAAEAPTRSRKRKPSKSKPIKKEESVRHVKLAPGELDDPIDDIFPK